MKVEVNCKHYQNDCAKAVSPDVNSFVVHLEQRANDLLEGIQLNPISFQNVLVRSDVGLGVLKGSK